MGTLVSLKSAKRVPRTIQNRKVTPRRAKNADLRQREYLTPAEAKRIIEAAGKVGRHGHRDSTLLLLAYRHGLRVSELVSLEWHQADLKPGLLHVKRRKNGVPSVHPLRGIELRALRRLERESSRGRFLFMSERAAPLTTDAVRKIVQRAGQLAGLEFPVHPHMLRHACGYKLANEGHDTRSIQHYLGHKNIQHTVRYTEPSPQRFKDFWRD